ncbi:DUF3572 family protein [Antarcticirhabdus aurantiaca]
MRADAQKPAFFMGLIDFILPHELKLLDFAGRAGL